MQQIPLPLLPLDLHTYNFSWPDTEATIEHALPSCALGLAKEATRAKHAVRAAMLGDNTGYV